MSLEGFLRLRMRSRLPSSGDWGRAPWLPTHFLALGVTLTGLADGLEPPSAPGAAAPHAPIRLRGKFGSPVEIGSWPNHSAFAKNCGDSRTEKRFGQSPWSEWARCSNSCPQRQEVPAVPMSSSPSVKICANRGKKILHVDERFEHPPPYQPSFTNPSTPHVSNLFHRPPCWRGPALRQ